MLSNGQLSRKRIVVVSGSMCKKIEFVVFGCKLNKGVDNCNCQDLQQLECTSKTAPIPANNSNDGDNHFATPLTALQMKPFGADSPKHSENICNGKKSMSSNERNAILEFARVDMKAQIH